MPDEPDLEGLYGVRARAVEALPWGEDGRSFRVRTGGSDYHLKTLGRPVDAFALDLVRQLGEADAFPHVPRLVPARDGSLCPRHGDTYLVLSEWIDGPPVHPLGQLPEAIRLPLARTLGTLHAVGGSLNLDAAPLEDYRIPFAATLGQALQGPLPDPARGYRSRIERELETLERVARSVADLGARRVLCHTDVHGGNLVLDAAGSIWLFDWDGARLAPCEQDLAGATNAHVPRGEFAAFIGAYQEARAETLGAPVELHAELFEFYYRRRCLEDLDAFLERLRTGRGDEAYLLGLLESECLGWLDRMDDDVSFVRGALSADRT